MAPHERPPNSAEMQAAVGGLADLISEGGALSANPSDVPPPVEAKVS